MTFLYFLKDLDSLQTEKLPGGESELFEIISKYFDSEKNQPVFLFMGKIFSEETRRELRNLSYENPLFFVEINDAPNHLVSCERSKTKKQSVANFNTFFFIRAIEKLSVVFLPDIPNC